LNVGYYGHYSPEIGKSRGALLGKPTSTLGRTVKGPLRLGPEESAYAQVAGGSQSEWRRTGFYLGLVVVLSRRLCTERINASQESGKAVLEQRVW